MVVKIATYAGEFLHHRNMKVSEFCLVADARLHEQLWRLDGAEREHDFKRSRDADKSAPDRKIQRLSRAADQRGCE